MFCPRCGASILDGLKFCRNCGLPVTQVSTYVATGGTASLTPLPDVDLDEYLTPLQKLILTIFALVVSPAVVAILAEMLGFDGTVAAIPSVFMPIGITWAIFHYKAVMRRRKHYSMQLANQLVIEQPRPAQIIDPGVPVLPTTQTNPLSEPRRGSVVEDETQRFR